MIPSDDHPLPDLSPSVHPDHQKSHDFKIICEEKFDAAIPDIDLFVDLDANNKPQFSFSIRDYVFNSRRKNIACNWPFSHKILHICLQHEVKNILPPFQYLESLRNYSINEEIISSCNEKSKLELKKSKNLSLIHLQQDLGQQIKSKKPVLGSYRKTETETAAAMASKICPVCKIFSSSSNTTLNAHIDQCLTVESTMMCTSNREVIIKHRIKPRKMRLMVDIYKTAPHCNVEELDARNGTSGANNSSFLHQEIECEATTNVDQEADVYSGNTKTKIRILSVPKANNNSSNDVSQKKGGESVKGSLGKKKSKNQECNYDQKYLLKSPNNKKSSSQVTAVQEEHVGSGDICSKEAMINDDFPIVRPPWACSKRTRLAKTNLSVASDESFSRSGYKPASISSNKVEIFSQKGSQETEALTPSKVLFAKRSLLLTKPSSKHLKKHGKSLHNSPVDLSVSCLVNRSDVRSKGNKNLLLVSRKTASKISMKRKFEALRRCQDSWKQKSWIKEDTSGKTSSKSMNLLEVKKNEKMEICRPENSVSSKSLNQNSIEYVRKEARSNEDQVISSMQVPRSSDNIFGSRERAIDATDDIEIQQPPYHDMCDSPNSTISNSGLPRFDSDKFSVTSTPKINENSTVATFKGWVDWISKGQSQTTSFKNDHQPCCCSRKEIASSRILTSSTCHDQSTPLRKPVIRLMGKDLTVVNTYEDKVNCGHVENRYNSFKSQHSTFHPDNSLENHALDIMCQNTYVNRSPHVGPMLPANQDRKNSLAFNNGSFQACSSFMELSCCMGSSKGHDCFANCDMIYAILHYIFVKDIVSHGLNPSPQGHKALTLLDVSRLALEFLIS
ncbi:hypothetical protein R6Q57_022504 [Mikania cordata]